MADEMRKTVRLAYPEGKILVRMLVRAGNADCTPHLELVHVESQDNYWRLPRGGSYCSC